MSRKNGIKLTFGKGDAVVIFTCIMLAAFIGVLFARTAGTDKGETVAIYQDGSKIQEISLHENTEILIENSYTNRVMVKDEKVAIVESDCPGMDCVHSGWINGKGRSIVCLPNRVEIRIEGEMESEVDFIVR